MKFQITSMGGGKQEKVTSEEFDSSEKAVVEAVNIASKFMQEEKSHSKSLSVLKGEYEHQVWRVSVGYTISGTRVAGWKTFIVSEIV